MQKDNPVKPISSPEDIERIRNLIRSRPRDLLLFDLAIETGIPANQLLRLKVGDLYGLEIGDKLPFVQDRPNRHMPALMGQRTFYTFQRYLAEVSSNPDEYLFRSRKGSGPLSVSSASRLARGWFEQAGLKGLNGFLTLRKTWIVRQDLLPGDTDAEEAPAGEEQTYRLSAIRTPTMQELVYKELEKAIVTARIKPGEKLVTEELARQMGISRIPVREAIGRLEARNFVKIFPQKGVIVNELSEKNLKEILEIRLMLEIPTSEKAAARRSEKTLQILESLNEMYLEAHRRNDADKLLRINQEFHFTIYREAQMPILLSIIENLWNQVNPYYHLMFRQTIILDPQTGVNYHKKILKGLEERNQKDVSRWLKQDLSEAAEFVCQVLHHMQHLEGISGDTD